LPGIGVCQLLQLHRFRREQRASFVNRLLRITLLAPNIQEAILDGRQPKGIQLEELARTMPSSWEKQEELVHFG
jgi:hypothetical protein